jgi:hypothetical protein
LFARLAASYGPGLPASNSVTGSILKNPFSNVEGGQITDCNVFLTNGMTTYEGSVDITTDVFTGGVESAEESPVGVKKKDDVVSMIDLG